MATTYIITDRVTADKYAISFDDGQIRWTVTASAASAEPIFEDVTNSSDNWRLFFSDGQRAIEKVVTVQDDNITLEDVTTGTNYRMQVDDGQFSWRVVAIVGAFVPRLPLLGVG